MHAISRAYMRPRDFLGITNHNRIKDIFANLIKLIPHFLTPREKQPSVMHVSTDDVLIFLGLGQEDQETGVTFFQF